MRRNMVLRDGVIETGEHGQPRRGSDRVEANIALALQQGRIASMEVPQWRQAFAANYERAMSQILARPVAAATRSLSDAWLDATLPPARRLPAGLSHMGG